MTAVRYATIKRIIAPGEESKVDITGKYVMVYEASHNDFKARFGDNGQLQPWAKGIVIGDRDDPLPFEEMMLVNTSIDEVLTIIIAYGHGQIRDARTAFTGGNMPVVFEGTQPVNVQNFPATAPLNFDGTQPVAVQNFPAIQPVNFNGTQPVAVQNFPSVQNVQQAPVSFGAETVSAAYSATTEIISAAANANGLIIRTAALTCFSGSGTYHLKIGNNVILTARDNEIAVDRLPYELLVPAGNLLQVVKDSGSPAYLHMSWDYL